MNHDKDLDRQLDTLLVRFFDGQLSVTQTREQLKRITGRSFLDITDGMVVEAVASKYQLLKEHSQSGLQPKKAVKR